MYCFRIDISIGKLGRLYLIPNIEVCQSNRFLEVAFNIFFIYINITFSFENMNSENYQRQ